MASQIPFMGQTLEEIAARRRAFEMAMNQLAAEQGQIYNRYGLAGHYDASGALTGLGADPGNPTGLYQQMRRGEAGDLQNLEEAQAQRGFTGGLLGQQTQNLRYNQHVGDVNFLQDVMSQLGNVQNAKEQATFGYNDDVRHLLQGAALDAIKNRDFTPVSVPARHVPKRVHMYAKSYKTFTPGQRALLKAKLKKHGDTMKDFRHKHPGVLQYLF